MKSLELVSVIIPVYNSEKHLKECLDSVINQSYENIEIIIIDDGSTDNSINILKEYINIDSRILLYSQKNSGPGSARNKAMGISNGKYIIFIDSDDYIKKNCIENLVLNIRFTDSEVLVYEAIGFYEKNNNRILDKEKYFNVNEKFLNNDMTGGEASKFSIEYISPCLKLYNKNFLQKNKIKFSEGIFGEDVEFWYKCIINLKKVKFINYVGYFRRYTPNSIMQSIDKKQLLQRISTINNIKKYIENSSINDMELRYIKEGLALYTEALYKEGLKYDNKNRKILINELKKNEMKDIFKEYSICKKYIFYRMIMYNIPITLNLLWKLKKSLIKRWR